MLHAYAQEIAGPKDIQRIYTNFYGTAPKTVSGQQHPQIRGFSWHNNEINKIRSGHYSSNDFQDSNKRKVTENKTLGYLPRVLFFNAFELGAKNCESSNIK
jgi:hypothetical protein